MPRKSLPRARIQGNLDGLCGVYAVVNSVRNLSPTRFTRVEEKELFCQLIAKLGEEGRLEDALCHGMKVRLLGRLIDAAIEFLETNRKYRLSRELAFGQAPEGLQDFWDKISTHLDDHGSGSVILGLGGKCDHWTCVDKASETALTLIDSDGIRRLQRKRCTISAAQRTRHHELWPTQTYLLRADTFP